MFSFVCVLTRWVSSCVPNLRRLQKGCAQFYNVLCMNLNLHRLERPDVKGQSQYNRPVLSNLIDSTGTKEITLEAAGYTSLLKSSNKNI